MTQVLSMLESLPFFISALVLGMLGPAALLSLAQVLRLLEPIFFTSEVHVLSMSEPLPFLCFFKRFSLFLENENCNGMYNGNETGNCELAEVVSENPAINRTPK